MPPFRNPFVKRAAAAAVPTSGASLIGDENARPVAANGIDKESSSSRPEYAGSRASSALSIKSRQEEPREYKLSGKEWMLFSFSFSPHNFFHCLPVVYRGKTLTHYKPPEAVVNDSGVYLPVTYSLTALASSYIRGPFLREELIWAMHI